MAFYSTNKFVGTNVEFKAFLQGRESIRAIIVETLREAPIDQDGWAVVNIESLIETLGETYESK